MLLIIPFSVNTTIAMTCSHIHLHTINMGASTYDYTFTNQIHMPKGLMPCQAYDTTRQPFLYVKCGNSNNTLVQRQFSYKVTYLE